MMANLPIGFQGLFSNHYVATCATFATIGGLLFVSTQFPPCTLSVIVKGELTMVPGLRSGCHIRHSSHGPVS